MTCTLQSTGSASFEILSSCDDCQIILFISSQPLLLAKCCSCAELVILLASSAAEGAEIRATTGSVADERIGGVADEFGSATSDSVLYDFEELV